MNVKTLNGSITGLMFLLAGGCGDGPPAPAETGLAGGLAEALGGNDTAGFERATSIREFEFPRDHGPHPAYRNEWWYVTGNLEDAAGRRFGFQLTFFRVGLAPGPEKRPSRWATKHAWMAHFALTDVKNQAFHAFERFARGGELALAGAEGDPVAVWLEDWRLERRNDGRWHLRAAADGLTLDLDLDPVHGPVLQGDRGLSRKSAAEGNASYYYSLTRIAARGRLTLDDAANDVRGTAWLDREWSTSALGSGQVGWDWFALHLDDGTDLMIYRLRNEDGDTSRWSAGTVVGTDGSVTSLGADDFKLRVLDRWTSPRGGTYPARWTLTIESLPDSLTVTPVLAGQELDAAVRYWEGAVDVHRDGKRIGAGYVELTGYADTDDKNR
jgi:predicted secreted hydrolase